MKGQQNPLVQIFVGVSTAVLTAFLIWKLGIEHKEPSPQPDVVVIREGDRKQDNIQPIYDDLKPKYIHARITDRLGIDQYGWGQVAESVSIEIDGNIQYINLSSMNNKISGSVRFKLPKDGFYYYKISVTTTFNNHHYYGQPCTHNGYGEGRIFIEDGKVYEMVMDPNTINNALYKTWLQEV